MSYGCQTHRFPTPVCSNWRDWPICMLCTSTARKPLTKELSGFRRHCPTARFNFEHAVAAGNLLRQIDLRKHVVKGIWNNYRGMLVSPEDSGARVIVPAELPAEYDLTVLVERKTRNNQFALGLTVDGTLTYGAMMFLGSSSSVYQIHKIELTPK